jgi:hypothetical protein
MTHLERKRNRKQIEECKVAFRKAVHNDGTKEDMKSFSKAWKEYRRKQEDEEPSSFAPEMWKELDELLEEDEEP